MFSGIVEEAATVVGLRKDDGNLHITLRCSFTDELKIDQSVAHNGVCLTVVELPGDGTYTVTAIQETLDRSNLGLLKPGDKVNLERSMMMNGRLDGHIVQGHVDQTARCVSVTPEEGSWRYRFGYESNPTLASKGYVTVEKGSVTVNGDLTIASDGLMKAEKCGFRKMDKYTENGLVGYHSHGGRTLAYGKTLRLHYQGYDSVFNPCLPGCTVPHTGGQGAGNAGGVLNCTVTGALTVDGTISANGSLGGQAVTHNDNAGPGGALLLKVGTLSGSGVIQADGGYNGVNSSGGGGRVAVRLTKSGATFDDFTGRIIASGRYSQNAAYASHSSSAGSVYLETAADGEKGGVIRIAQGLNYAQNVLNTNTTELVSLGYGGDDVADYKKVKVEVRDYGFAAVNTDVKVKSVTLATADAKLDLEGNTLTADTFRYPDADGKLKKLKPGTYTLDQLKTLGIERVCDSVGGGRLVIRGTGMVLLVR